MTTTDERPAPEVSGATPRLNKALAAVQAVLPRIAKGETVLIQGSQGKRDYTYDYADLSACSEAILPLLGKNGLAFSTRPTLVDGKFVLVYELLHESGESKSGIFPLAASGRPQDLGSLLTYYRRYALCAVTGIAPGGEDNDAQTANNVQQFDRPHSPAESFESAAPAPRPQPPADEDDGDNGDWLAGIDSQAAADKADAALREAFKSGAMGPAKAHRIRTAIQELARELAEKSAPRSQPGDVDEATAKLGALAVSARTLDDLKAVHASARSARKLAASFIYEGTAVTLQSFIAARKAEFEAGMAGAGA